MAGGEADYAKMYQKLMQATEKAVRLLIQAQRECEEMYIRAGEDGKVIELGICGDSKEK